MATIPAESKSRAVCSLRIQFKLEHASEPRQLSTAESKTPGATVPTTIVAENATTRSQDASGPTSQLCKSVIIGRIREPSLTNNSKSMRECQHSITEKS
ncbi:hypothetical protein CR513_51590, partial [Mucuna pruriens]